MVDNRYTGGEIILKALSDQDVDVVFGYPGGVTLPLYDKIYLQNKIRHILVGVISAKSPAESAAILAADNPSKALAEHMASTGSGQETPLDTASGTDSARQQVSKNENLMRALNVSGTPSIYYPQPDGSIGYIGGMPQPQQLAEVMGEEAAD